MWGTDTSRQEDRRDEKGPPSTFYRSRPFSSSPALLSSLPDSSSAQPHTPFLYGQHRPSHTRSLLLPYPIRPLSSSRHYHHARLPPPHPPLRLCPGLCLRWCELGSFSAFDVGRVAHAFLAAEGSFSSLNAGVKRALVNPQTSYNFESAIDDSCRIMCKGLVAISKVRGGQGRGRCHRQNRRDADVSRSRTCPAFCCCLSATTKLGVQGRVR